MENNDDDRYSYSSMPSLISDREIEERKEIENEAETKDDEDDEEYEEYYDDYNSVPLLRNATRYEEEIDEYRRGRYLLPTPSRFPVEIITRKVFYKNIAFTIVIPSCIQDVEGYTANIQSDLLAFEKSCENSRYQILESLNV